MLAALICPQISLAEGFTGREFLAWQQASQDSYLQTSVTMASMIIAQTNAETGACVDDWYFGDQAMIDRRNAELRDQIEAYDGYHPSAVIAAVLQKQCGSFK